MPFNPSLCIKPFSNKPSSHGRQQQDYPTSPKVSCMGQVRRCTAAEKISASTQQQASSRHSGGRRLYFFMAYASFLASPMNGGNCRQREKSKKVARVGRRVAAVDEPDSPVEKAVVEMDPPLPVVAAVGTKECEIGAQALSLWKRRCRSRKLDELFFCRLEKQVLPAASGLAG